jgi:signal transduction histidine kinase
VALSVYRIVQETLTNARKHAPGAPVDVGIRCGPDGVHVTVSNPLPGTVPVPPAHGAGHGLLGMRERVAAFGGSLSAGPEGARFVVSAALPARMPVSVP